jgi:hypothetical protein
VITIDAYATGLVATAPAPTPEQLALLRGLLGPALAAAPAGSRGPAGSRVLRGPAVTGCYRCQLGDPHVTHETAVQSYDLHTTVVELAPPWEG